MEHFAPCFDRFYWHSYCLGSGMHRSQLVSLPVVLTAFLLAGCQSANTTYQQNQWMQSQGGVVLDQRESRVRALCEQLTRDVVRTPVRIHVLANHALAAYSWSTGDIYVSSGLVDLLADDQLRACIAHEMGHLLNDRHCDAVAALQGGGRHGDAAGYDEEKAADATGARLLTLHGYRPQALADALQRVHDRAGCDGPRTALASRIGALRADLP